MFVMKHIEKHEVILEISLNHPYFLILAIALSAEESILILSKTKNKSKN